MFGFYKLIRPLFSDVFIAINVDDNICQIRVLRTKKEKILEEVEKEFKIIDRVLPYDAVRFIENYKKHYPFCYIGVVSKTQDQNIFHVSKIKELPKIGVDIREYRTLAIGDWGIYIKKSEIDRIQRFFGKFHGVDYIFSPFVLLYKRIKDRLEPELKLYVLQEKTHIAMLVANKDDVYFSKFLSVEMLESGARGVENPLFFNNETGGGSTFGGFEDLDLDFMRDLDFKEEGEPRVDESEKRAQEASVVVDEISRAAVVAGIIQEALSEFYDNEFYEEGFVEEIVFLDNIEMKQEAADYIQQTLLLPVQRMQIKLMEDVLESVQQEFKWK